jgi:hypothetical protein
MSRALLAAGLAGMLLLGLQSMGCGDECSPGDFGGGNECGPDEDSFQSCSFSECIEGPVCNERYTIRTGYCPSFAPICKSSGPGEIVCLGENVGSCTAPGFVRCDDVTTVVLCAPDEAGQLFLSRGACAVGARCHPSQGCDPAF